MSNRRPRTGYMRTDEKIVTDEILVALNLKHLSMSEDAWNTDMCREVVQYMPMKYLRFYIKTEDDWTPAWMEAVHNELSDRALFNVKYKKLPCK